MSRRRVVVTGLGLVSPHGSDVETFWQRLLAGKSAVGPLRRFDASAFPARIAAEVPDLSAHRPPESELPRPWEELDPIARFAFVAAQSAIADSGLLAEGPDRSRIGVLVAAGTGTFGHRELFAPLAVARPPGIPRVAGAGVGFDPGAYARGLAQSLLPRAAERRTPGSIAALLAHTHGFGGPVSALTSGGAAGTQALGDAARWIRTGQADVVVAGAADSEILPLGLASFCRLGLLSRRNADPAAASRPFDAGRDGCVLGEGAGLLVLEERGRAIGRGARILAEIAGFGAACDAYSPIEPHPDGKGSILAIERALADAGIPAAAIRYVHANGAATLAHDRSEARALHRVFGDGIRRLPVSSIKSMIGHLQVAAGAVEAIATVLALSRRTLPPTINQDERDALCDLDTIPDRARPLDAAPESGADRGGPAYALTHSVAFGGPCASLIFRSGEADDDADGP